MSPALPPLIERDAIQARLKRIFPDGTPNRGYCIREIAASTIFALLYVGAIRGTGRFASPQHVYRMTDRQAAKRNDVDRLRYASTFRASGRHWYADTTREPIRDETLREALIPLGAAVARDDLPTTSSKPRYALTPAFAVLFDPALSGRALDEAIEAWSGSNLSAGARARIQLLAKGVVATAGGVLVTFPNGETRRLAPGPSSLIAKAVIENFADRFLIRPGVVWLSESQSRVVFRDDDLARSIGLNISADRELPDLILVDLGHEKPLLVFVEVVATDGAITPRRQMALLAIARDAGFSRDQVAFVTAYMDRSRAAFKKTLPDVAWESFVWFLSEPNNLIVMRDAISTPTSLHDLL